MPGQRKIPPAFAELWYTRVMRLNQSRRDSNLVTPLVLALIIALSGHPSAGFSSDPLQRK